MSSIRNICIDRYNTKCCSFEFSIANLSLAINKGYLDNIQLINDSKKGITQREKKFNKGVKKDCWKNEIFELSDIFEFLRGVFQTSQVQKIGILEKVSK